MPERQDYLRSFTIRHPSPDRQNELLSLNDCCPGTDQSQSLGKAAKAVAPDLVLIPEGPNLDMLRTCLLVEAGHVPYLSTQLLNGEAPDGDHGLLKHGLGQPRRGRELFELESLLRQL